MDSVHHWSIFGSIQNCNGHGEGVEVMDGVGEYDAEYEFDRRGLGMRSQHGHRNVLLSQRAELDSTIRHPGCSMCNGLHRLYSLDMDETD